MTVIITFTFREIEMHNRRGIEVCIRRVQVKPVYDSDIVGGERTASRCGRSGAHYQVPIEEARMAPEPVWRDDKKKPYLHQPESPILPFQSVASSQL
jgi:hypothetical protein